MQTPKYAVQAAHADSNQRYSIHSGDLATTSSRHNELLCVDQRQEAIARSHEACYKRYVNFSDMERLAGIEAELKLQLPVCRIPDIPNFPYPDFQTLRKAKAEQEITFGANYHPQSVELLSTRSDRAVEYFYVGALLLAIVSFIAGAIATGKYVLLIGAITIVWGYLSSGRSYLGCAPLIAATAWLGVIYFATKGSPWAWVLSGFYAGLFIGKTLRLHFTQVMEARALESEIFFCYLFLQGILVLRDNDSGKLYHN